MFNILQRGQSVLNFSLTLVGFLSAFVVFSSWFLYFVNDSFNTPSLISNLGSSANIKFSRRFGSVGGKAKENNKLIFDLETDLTPLFNWNTKQVFIYLTAEYPGNGIDSVNKVTYWDKIIKSKDQAKLNLTNERSKYSVWDIEQNFENKDAIIKLEWNIQPWVGPLVYGSTTGDGSLTFPSPSEKVEKKKKKSST